MRNLLILLVALPGLALGRTDKTSTTPLKNSSCEKVAAALTPQIIQAGRLIDQECLQIQTNDGPRGLIAIVTVNHPELGAESYLVLTSKGDKLEQSLRLGLGAWKMNMNGQTRALFALGGVKENRIRVVTNVQVDLNFTELKIIEVDLSARQFKQLLANIFPDTVNPKANLVGDIWRFTGGGQLAVFRD
jgi:hypothetical protein